MSIAPRIERSCAQAGRRSDIVRGVPRGEIGHRILVQTDSATPESRIDRLRLDVCHSTIQELGQLWFMIASTPESAASDASSLLSVRRCHAPGLRRRSCSNNSLHLATKASGSSGTKRIRGGQPLRCRYTCRAKPAQSLLYDHQVSMGR